MEYIKYAVTLFVFVSVITTLVMRFEARFNKLSLKIASLEQKIEPFWEIVKSNVSKLFTENPSAELLAILDRADTLTKEEILQAKLEFEKEMLEADPSKRFNYLLAIWRLDTASNEKKE